MTLAYPINTFGQRVSQMIFNAIGWKFIADVPPTPKYLLIGAPHTSNWDFPLAVLIMARLGERLRWIGKDSLFHGIPGIAMKWMGGIPVERGARKNFVGQIVEIYNQSKQMVIAIAPEGTRTATDHWKTGFYHIARGANVPIAMGFADYAKKMCGVGGWFTPSENISADFDILRKFYSNVTGKYPHKQSQVRLLEE